MMCMNDCFTANDGVTTSDSAQQEMVKWQADREQWVRTFPAMGYLSQFLALTPVNDAHFKSASTDGKRLYICHRYSATLSDESRQFLQAHLIWHCVAGHLFAPLVSDHRRWHLACDHEVNALLLALNVPFPADALLYPACVGQSALSVYRWLEGHPNIAVEASMDIHPAALWHYLPSTQIEQSTLALWRQRAQLLAKEPGALPERVAKFCEAR